MSLGAPKNGDVHDFGKLDETLLSVIFLEIHYYEKAICNC